MIKFPGYLKSLPIDETVGKVNRFSEDSIFHTIQENVRKIPGYLKYAFDDPRYNYSMPYHTNLESKLMATPYLHTQTGHFRGQPGVLYRFNDRFNNKVHRDMRNLRHDPIRHVPLPTGQLAGKY